MTSELMKLPSKIIAYLTECFDKPPWFFLYADVVLAMMIIVDLLVERLPGYNLGWDNFHQSNIFMTGVRILDGQVPFKDFYCWYGPLYHYTAAFFLLIFGENVFSIRIFIDIISPIIYYIFLLIGVRLLALHWTSSAFIVISSALLSVDRMWHCGATRVALAVLVISFWIWLKGRTNSKIYNVISMPSCLLIFLYSPELGIFSFIVAWALIGLEIISKESSEIKANIIYHGIGIFILSVFVFILLVKTTFFKGYLFFTGITSSSMLWAYGKSFPEISFSKYFLTSKDYYYYLALAIPVTSSILIAYRFLLKGAKRISERSFAFTILSLLLFYSVYCRTDISHLTFVLQPYIILLSLAIPIVANKKYTYIVVMVLLALTLYFAGHYLIHNIQSVSYQLKCRKQVQENQNFAIPGGFIWPMKEKRAEEFKFIQSFSETYSDSKIIFPFHSFEANIAGRKPMLRHDDIYHMHHDNIKDEIIGTIAKINPEFICVSDDRLYETYTQEDINYLLDYLNARYQKYDSYEKIHFLRRNSEPRKLTTLIEKKETSITLSEKNLWRTKFKVPTIIEDGYIEFTYKFYYAASIFRKFSLPTVYINKNDESMYYNSHIFGVTHLNTSPKGSKYRIFLKKGIKNVEFIVVFLGVNIPPRKISISDISYYKFNFTPPISYRNYEKDPE